MSSPTDTTSAANQQPFTLELNLTGTPAVARDEVAELAAHAKEAGARLRVPPSVLSAIPKDLGVSVGSVAGFPTGQHHALIKATEARLAVEFGAEDIAVALDASDRDVNALITDLVTLREAVPHPAALQAIIEPNRLDQPNADAIIGAVLQAGYDGIVLGSGFGELATADRVRLVRNLTGPNFPILVVTTSAAAVEEMQAAGASGAWVTL